MMSELAKSNLRIALSAPFSTQAGDGRDDRPTERIDKKTTSRSAYGREFSSSNFFLSFSIASTFLTFSLVTPP